MKCDFKVCNLRSFFSANVYMKPEARYQVVATKGEEYLNFTDIDLRLNIRGASLDFDIFPTKEQNDILNNIAKLSMPFLIDVFQPIFAKALGEVILTQFQAVFQRYPLNTFLPE